MSVYRKVDPRVHSDRKYRALSDSGKLLFLTLLTHSNMTALGALQTTAAGLAEEMGWDLAQLKKAMSELTRAGLVQHDNPGRLVWLPNFFRFNQPENPNVVVGWGKAFEKLPDSRLLNAIAASAEAATLGRKETFTAALSRGLREAAAKGSPNRFPNGSPKGLPDGSADGMPNQEQEQEQEQEPRETSTRVGGDPPPRAHTHEGVRDPAAPGLRAVG